MRDRAKYEKLDDVWIIGIQEKKSAGSRKYQLRKTGEIFRRARAAAKTGSPKRAAAK